MLLAVVPPLICLLLVCGVGGALLLPANPSRSTPASGQPTQPADATALHEQRLQQAAASATAALLTQEAASQASATALAAGRLQSLTEQALTQAAVPTSTVNPTATSTIDPTYIPTITPTPPEFVTLTLIECRGDEATVIFNDSQTESLHAYSKLSFTVKPGTYHLQVFWLNDPSHNQDSQLNLQRDTALVYGDNC